MPSTAAARPSTSVRTCAAAASPRDGGFVDRRGPLGGRLLAYGGGAQFGEAVRAVHLEAASRFGVMDGPRAGNGQGVDRLDPDTREDGSSPLAFHPVVPRGNDEAVFYGGIKPSAERAATPSLIERALDIIPARDDAAPAAIGADAFGRGRAGVKPGGVVDR